MTTKPKVDSVLADAVDQARRALEPIASEEEIGKHLGVKAEGERLLTHAFECLKDGYRGWKWVTTLARVPRGRTPTVCEIDLLPGKDALLAPDWIPWADRVTPAELKHNVEESMLPKNLREEGKPERQRGPKRYTNALEVYYLGLAARMCAGLDVAYRRPALNDKPKKKSNHRKSQGKKKKGNAKKKKGSSAKKKQGGSKKKKS